MKHKKKVNSVADTAVELNDHQQGDVETSVLENALALITREFGLSSKEYIVSAFADKADRVAVTVCNDEYDVTVTIKLPVELGVK